MKTKVLKFGMPLMAFMLAILFAFATPKEGVNDSTIVNGYILQNNDCVQVTHPCSLEPGPICELETGEVVYATKSGTVCLSPMFRW